ncbi:MAG: hypothetical protein ACLPJY_03620 [Rhodomicrobium sp.]
MTTPSMTSIAEADYCAIEDALQSTEKGRRFLRAYTERNRSLESRRLLRSISRLHRAALGTPGINAEVCRDLISVLRSVTQHRQAATECVNPASRSLMLEHSLDEVESCLIALVESIEESALEALGDGTHGSPLGDADEISQAGRSAKLFGELSSYFSIEPR